MSPRWIPPSLVCAALGCSATTDSTPASPSAASHSSSEPTTIAKPLATSTETVPLDKLTAEKRLHEAFARGDLKTVQQIAKQFELREFTNLPYYVLASPNAELVRIVRDQARFNISDLQIAAISGDVTEVDRFLANLAEDERRISLQQGYSPFSSYSPLRLAVWRGHLAVVEKLIQFGADVNEVSRYSLSPLANAAEAGNIEMLKLLLESGADINTQANDEYTALMRACIGGQSKTAVLLLEAGADPNLKRHDGRRALHFSALRGDVECVKLLLKYDADINAIAYGKDTALSDAESNKHPAVVDLLKAAQEK